MANGLNQRFGQDPVAFLSSYQDVDVDRIRAGEGYGIDAKGIASLDLREAAPGTILVDKADGGLLARLGREAPVRAYYLPARIDRTMALPLGDECDFFFTDPLAGSQFMAYGNNRNKVTVCHVNAATQGAVVYQHEAATVRCAGYAVEIVYGQAQYRARLPTPERARVRVTVIGWRRADGWHFYARRCVDGPDGRRALGSAAVEL